MKQRNDESFYADEENLRLLDEDVRLLGRQAAFALSSLAVIFIFGFGFIGYVLNQEMSRSASVAYAPQYEMNSYRR